MNPIQIPVAAAVTRRTPFICGDGTNEPGDLE